MHGLLKRARTALAMSSATTLPLHDSTSSGNFLTSLP